MTLAFGVIAQQSAAQELRIGVAAPLSGPLALLGEQVKNGAWEAVKTSPVSMLLTDEQCTAEGGAQAARRFVENKVALVSGFLCAEAAEAALPILKQAGIPMVSPGVRADRLTDTIDKTRHLFFRLGPKQSHEAEAAARIVAERWRDTLFAIVDDGTIYGRELAESVRFAVEQAGLKPVFLDTFRPQLDNQIALLGRLRRAGATHVFVGGDREDIAIMARDAVGLGYDATIAGGEALRAAGTTPLTAGLLMVGLPETAKAAEAVTGQLRGQGIEPEGYVLPAYAAMQTALAALRASEGDPARLVASLREDRFDTVVGSVKFDQKGDLAENPYRLFRYDGTGFSEVE